MSTDFFTATFGFSERNYLDTQKQLADLAVFEAVGSWRSVPLPFAAEQCRFKVSAIDGAAEREVEAGVASTPSVAELRNFVEALLQDEEVRTTIREWQGAHPATTDAPIVSFRSVVGESRGLHSEAAAFNSVVQAASQFNLLEFASPEVTPERGIKGYLYDRTQGPACAIACAAGTAYRNYLMPTPFTIEGDGIRRGQTASNQINCLADIEAAVGKLGGGHGQFWRTRNGYVESKPDALAAFNALLTPELAESLSELLRIGVQQDTEVTDAHAGCQDVKVEIEKDGKKAAVWRKEKLPQFAGIPFTVTQAYCAAISVGYSRCHPDDWRPLAQLVLNGTYEATLLVGVIQTIRAIVEGKAAKFGLPIIYLTKVGGGVFANDASWINNAIARALKRVAVFDIPLDIRLVHYGSIESGYANLSTQ